MSEPLDAVVVGAGPNGLAAALTLARGGLEVLVLEGATQAGGGTRTEDLTLPGFHHDVCSAVHPLVAASPFFAESGVGAALTLLQPEVAFAHPLDGGRCGVVVRSLEETADGLGPDGGWYRRLIAPLVAEAPALVETFLSSLRQVPRHPLSALRLGVAGLLPAQVVARVFSTDEGAGILAGVAAHAMQPLSAPPTAAYGLFLAATAHYVGWPVVEGGSQGIADALVAAVTDLGGRVETGHRVRSLAELPSATVTLLDVSPRQFATLAGDTLSARARRSVERFRYGPGVCKVDWALDGPVPWTAEACHRSGTVHVGGRMAEVVAAEADVAAGRHPERPFCLVTQPGVVDLTRAPTGQSTLWAYCHVPSGSTVDMTGRIEDQIERFAPGFRDRILARVTRTAAEAEAANPNYVGGDINGGAATLWQTVFRPGVQWNPYRTVLPGVYLCSASTPPGGGVHGMCGLHAAHAALADHFRSRAA